MASEVNDTEEDEEDQEGTEDSGEATENIKKGGMALNDQEIREKLRKASEQVRMQLQNTPPPPSMVPKAVEEAEGEANKEDQEGEGGEENQQIKSPEEDLMDSICNELSEELPKITKADRKTVDFAINLLRHNPGIAFNKANLYLHIKSIVPRINDYLLHSLIDNIFAEHAQEFQSIGTPFEGGMDMGYSAPFGPTSSPYSPGPFPQVSYPRYYGYGGGNNNPYIQNPNADLDRQAMLERLEQMREKHELEMEELKQRIVAQSQQQKEQTVKLNVNGQVIDVPASVVPFILMMQSQKKEEDKIPVDFNGKTITVPASMAPLYMALSTPKESEEMKELKAKLDILQQQAEKEKNDQLMNQIAELREEIASMKEQPSVLDQIRAVDQMAQSLGYKKSGTTVVDLLTNAEHDVHQVASTVATKIQPPSFQPEVKRSPEERRELAQKMAKGAEAGAEIAKAEDELLEALKG